MTNLREHKCHHIDWRQERTWMWRFQWCHRSKVLKAHGEHRHIMPGDCLTSGGALRKVEWPAWALMEGRTQDKGHLAPPLPWLCAIDKRWHYGQDTWVSKRRHTSPHTWLKPKVDCWKSRPELTLSLVWWKSPKVSMSASFWWHNLMWSRKKKKKKILQQEQSAVLLEPANHRAPGQLQRHEFTGASGQCHLYHNPGQPQAQDGLTNFQSRYSKAWGPLRPGTQAGTLLALV